MMKLEKKEIEALDRIYRLNLINSLSGVKSANLIGTKSKSGQDNLAVFSSVVHLGSSPALIGFVMRPQADRVTDTYRNITETGYYTINHVSTSFVQKAHHTSAKFKTSESEFHQLGIGKLEEANFHAPFVKDSVVRIAMCHQEEIALSNGCLFMIGAVECVYFPEESISDEGHLDLSQYDCAGISGLNTYYGLTKLATYPYARTNEIPATNEEK